MLKQAHATAVSHSTEDQASSHAAQEKAERHEFELDVTEQAPTSDQMKNILEYLGGPTAGAAGKIVRGARDERDAVRRVGEDGESFLRPVVSELRVRLRLRWEARNTGLGVAIPCIWGIADFEPGPT